MKIDPWAAERVNLRVTGKPVPRPRFVLGRSCNQIRMLMALMVSWSGTGISLECSNEMDSSCLIIVTCDKV